MKLKSTLLATALVAFAASTATAFAAEEHPAAAKAEKTEAVKTENGEAKKPVKKRVKKHSHMEEKTGIPMPEHVQDASKKEASKNRHDHTQERR